MEELAWVQKAQEWLVTNGANFLVDVAVFVLILVIGKFVIKAICNMTRTMLKKSKRVSQTLENFSVSILSKVLWIVLLMIALPRLGVSIAPLIAGLGVTGFIFGFAFQESLANLAAGLMIMLNAPFKVGDSVLIAGHTGAVNEMNMMAITVITADNKKVIIPNKAVWGGAIVNLSALEKK